MRKPGPVIVLGVLVAVLMLLPLWLLFSLDFHWTAPKASDPISVEQPDQTLPELNAEQPSGDAITQRPLFWESRRPPPEPAEPDEQPAERTLENPFTQARLLGVFHAEQGGGILLIPAEDQAPKRLNRGEDYQGWVLTELTPRRAVFSIEHNEQTHQHTLELESRLP